MPTAALAAVVAVSSAVAEQPVPTPIGQGAAYRPAPRGPLPRDAGRSRCVRGGLGDGMRVHLELFANRRVVIVPAAIGVEGVQVERLGRILAARCQAATWTLDPTGVVWFARHELRLGDLFTIWRQPLARNRLLGFRARPGGGLLVFRNGKRLRMSPSEVELRARDEIVLELNGYVRPHRSYVFPQRDR